MTAEHLQILVKHPPFVGHPMLWANRHPELSANQANVLAKWNAKFALDLILPVNPLPGTIKN